ncbi:hypothetical protein VYU27_007357, partial [Nannochloropsis oceanica]
MAATTTMMSTAKRRVTMRRGLPVVVATSASVCSFLMLCLLGTGDAFSIPFLASPWQAGTSAAAAAAATATASRVRRGGVQMGMGNSFGRLFRISTFGESHGGGVGVVVDGCPPRVEITREEIQQELDRR